MKTAQRKSVTAKKPALKAAKKPSVKPIIQRTAPKKAMLTLGKELTVRFKEKFKQEMQQGLAEKAARKLSQGLMQKLDEKTSARKSSEAKSGGLREGSVAPAFSVVSDAGEKVSLSQFRGKKVVLYFYPKDDTPGCTQESCDFRDSLARLKSAGAVVLGVSKDSIQSHGKFKKKYSLPFTLLSDEDTALAKAYGVWKMKTNYGRDYMGMERTTFLIDVASSGKGKILKVYPKVKVKGHVDEVLRDLSALKERA